jgi:non-ribosomal peptide synthetase component F
VAVAVPRPADYVARVLGVLKTGGGYLPLPEARIRCMPDQTRARILAHLKARCAHRTRLSSAALVFIAPLGRPVEPEVKMT